MRKWGEGVGDARLVAMAEDEPLSHPLGQKRHPDRAMTLNFAVATATGVPSNRLSVVACQRQPLDNLLPPVGILVQQGLQQREERRADSSTKATLARLVAIPGDDPLRHRLDRERYPDQAAVLPAL